MPVNEIRPLIVLKSVHHHSTLRVAEAMVEVMGGRIVEPVEATPVVTAVTFAAPAETLAAPAPASTEAARPLMVYEFQQRLAERGYYPGVIDGDYGHHTRMAVARCQQAYGLPVDGEPTPDTLRALGF
jgi:peptidoglycan hydrolase-like protein with peptidoglycan-binding domain